MAEEDGVVGAALVVGRFGGFLRDALDEGFVVGEFDEGQALLDEAGGALAVALDIAEEGGKFPRLEDELAERFVAEVGLLFAGVAFQVGVQAD